jgi:hypothetical protein
VPLPPSSSSAWQARQALGARLGEIRKDAGLTGRALALLCGWHESKVSRIEHARTGPSADDPDAEVAVVSQQDGVKVVISGSEMGSGASGPHAGTDVKLCLSDDGPLIRFLLNGHL